MGCPHRRHGTGSLAAHRFRRLRQAELAYSGLDFRVPPGFTAAGMCGMVHLFGDYG